MIETELIVFEMAIDPDFIDAQLLVCKNRDDR